MGLGKERGMTATQAVVRGTRSSVGSAAVAQNEQWAETSAPASLA